MKNELISLVRLRALEPEDLQLLYTIENDEDLWDVSNNCIPLSKFALRKYLATQPQGVYQSEELRLVIEEEQTSNAVGLLDLTGISFLDRRAEVGIALLKSERGKGFGHDALRSLERYAKRKLDLRMLFAQIAIPNNMASAKLFDSLGYEQIALLPEWHYRNGTYEDIAVFRKKL